MTSTHASKVHTRCQKSQYVQPMKIIPTREEFMNKKYGTIDEETVPQWLARKAQEKKQHQIAMAQDANIRGYYDGCTECGYAESQGAFFTTIKNGLVCDDCL